MNSIEQAKKVATEAHANQFRWDGKPYITHPEAVANMVLSTDEKIVAWLHDIVEDTPYSYEQIEQNFGKLTADSVYLLTKNNNRTYLEYILNIKTDVVARNVKIADIMHNLSTLDYNKKKDKYEKYMLALHILRN